MADLTEREKQLLAQMKAQEKADIEAESKKPAIERVVPMPSDKTDFPLGIIPDADSSTSESD